MQNEHGDGHIGNTLSICASAYQGNTIIHLTRRPLRALDCGPEAMVLVEQNSSSSLPIWLDTKQPDFASIAPNEHASSERSLACSLGLHIGSQPYSGRSASACQDQSFQNLRVLAMQYSSSLREAIKSKLHSSCVSVANILVRER